MKIVNKVKRKVKNFLSVDKDRFPNNKMADDKILDPISYSDDAINTIKRFEGFVPNVYECPAGKPTIGYGHQITLDDHYTNFTELSEADAEKLLKDDLNKMCTSLFPHIEVILTQGQYDALCSLVYNWGEGNFLASQGFKLLNKLDYDGASYQFFNKQVGVVNINGEFSQGLYNRRYAEQGLWDN